SDIAGPSQRHESASQHQRGSGDDHFEDENVEDGRCFSIFAPVENGKKHRSEQSHAQPANGGAQRTYAHGTPGECISSLGGNETARGNSTAATAWWITPSVRERLSATTYVPMASGASSRTTIAWSAYTERVPHIY